MAKGLQLYVLGSLQILLDERPLTADLISQKGQALLVYLYVVAPRGGSELSMRFLKELNQRWPDQCQLIGNHPPIGAERPLWELDATGARSST